MVERKLKQLGKEKFELRTVDKKNDLVTIKGYKKTELKDIYRELKLRIDQTAMQKHKLESDIKKLDVEDTPDLREFAERLDGASKLLQKDKIETQMVLIKKELDMLKKQIKEISDEIPELLRNK